MTKLFISGLPRRMDEMELVQLVGPFDDIDLMTILRDKMTGKSECAGFVHMKTFEGAKEAIASLDGFEMGDCKLEVHFGGEKPEPSGKKVKGFKKQSTFQKAKRPRLSL